MPPEGSGPCLCARSAGEAGQKNNSAAQYHFGSKLGLVNAILDARSASVQQRRKELVASLDESDLRAVVTAEIAPLAESISDPGHSRFYLRFPATAVNDPALRAAWSQDPRPQQAEVRRLHRNVAALLPDIPRRVVQRRLEWAARVTLPLLAEHEELRHSGKGAADTALVVRELVDMQVALLSCPI
ncbi:hypothetical protein [Nocardioides sp. B-3]|uniref:hypothetical protein n=1 Tax=Nocardioides sp. B-3 TaxID=2895565 RepID=UPI0021521616|nr:hypothetical protein [Nocardioides sp. B-3]UUZ59415.1 hypothetical protein LP418_27060 [Nocardioides sp. B-3]